MLKKDKFESVTGFQELNLSNIFQINKFQTLGTSKLNELLLE